MDYEQKYKEALERARDLMTNQNPPAFDKDLISLIFPELKESEDEQIRKRLIRVFGSQVKEKWGGIPTADILAWLEKQGEKKPYGHRKECEDCQFNYAGECKGSCQMKRDEQKPTDKVEPKFKVGDWITNGQLTCKVLGSIGKSYELHLYNDDYCHFETDVQSVDEDYHLWTIADAKDGDVLVASDGSIFLFAGVDDCACKYYVALTTDNYVKINYVKINKEVDSGYWETSRAVYPATKEQRDTLIKAMANAGYTFDFEKKEFKKIETKTLNPDKVIEWLNDQACLGWIEDVEIDKFIAKFKEDFKL